MSRNFIPAQTSDQGGHAVRDFDTVKRGMVHDQGTSVINLPQCLASQNYSRLGTYRTSNHCGEKYKKASLSTWQYDKIVCDSPGSLDHLHWLDLRGKGFPPTTPSSAASRHWINSLTRMQLTADRRILTVTLRTSGASGRPFLLNF